MRAGAMRAEAMRGESTPVVVTVAGETVRRSAPTCRTTSVVPLIRAGPDVISRLADCRTDVAPVEVTGTGTAIATVTAVATGTATVVVPFRGDRGGQASGIGLIDLAADRGIVWIRDREAGELISAIVDAVPAEMVTVVRTGIDRGARGITDTMAIATTIIAMPPTGGIVPGGIIITTTSGTTDTGGTTTGTATSTITTTIPATDMATVGIAPGIAGRPSGVWRRGRWAT